MIMLSTESRLQRNIANSLGSTRQLPKDKRHAEKNLIWQAWFVASFLNFRGYQTTHSQHCSGMPEYLGAQENCCSSVMSLSFPRTLPRSPTGGISGARNQTCSASKETRQISTCPEALYAGLRPAAPKSTSFGRHLDACTFRTHVTMRLLTQHTIDAEQPNAIAEESTSFASKACESLSCAALLPFRSAATCM